MKYNRKKKFLLNVTLENHKNLNHKTVLNFETVNTTIIGQWEF